MVKAKSPRVLNAMAFLLDGNAMASQLSQIMNTGSREVFLVLKTWIVKGVISVTKARRRNVHMISHKVRAIVSNVTERYA
jgi:hypothetical protein